mmetsp:Transcript_80935/g.182607  ORF Transcript_80935/g.182607 Transcript_80935/m.182607 type:complete len:174 (-) Transcript_80935:118-639(-)
MVWCSACCHADEKGAEVLTVEQTPPCKPDPYLPPQEDVRAGKPVVEPMSPVEDPVPVLLPPPADSREAVDDDRLQEPEVEPTDPSEFKVTLRRAQESDKIGLNVSHVAEGAVTIALVVKEVKEGMVADWNREHPDQMVQVGHFIVGCNGTRDNSSKMLQRIGQDQVLELHIKR